MIFLNQWVSQIYHSTLEAGAADRFAERQLLFFCEDMGFDAACWQTFEGRNRKIAGYAVSPGLPETAKCLQDLDLSDAGIEGELRSMGVPLILRMPGVMDGFVNHFVFLRAHGQVPLDDERHDVLYNLCTHLPAARHMCLEFSARLVRATAAGEGAPPAGIAVASKTGSLITADELFREILLAADPDWNRKVLPLALLRRGDLVEGLRIRSGLMLRIKKLDRDYFLLELRNNQHTQIASARELEIADYVARGVSFREIARKLGLAPSTVSSHLYNLYAKLGFRGRAKLVRWMQRRKQS